MKIFLLIDCQTPVSELGMHTEFLHKVIAFIRLGDYNYIPIFDSQLRVKSAKPLI